MIIIPAIDLKDHKVVRLVQGGLEDETVYGDDPVAVARRWIDAGATRIHVVDLNGATKGKPVHETEVERLVETFPEIEFEIGGGIRKMSQLDHYMKTGVRYAVLGTAVINDPHFLSEACKKYPQRLIAGVDSKSGVVAIEGWIEGSGKKDEEVVREVSQIGVREIIYTDISKDGMLAGPNFDAIRKVAESSPVPVIASGGVSSEEDIKKLAAIPNVFGAIVGKALYEGKLDLAEAIGVARCL